MSNNQDSMFDQRKQQKGVRLLNRSGSNQLAQSGSPFNQTKEATPQSKQNQEKESFSAKLIGQSPIHKRVDIQVSQFITPSNQSIQNVKSSQTITLNKSSPFTTHYQNVPVIGKRIQFPEQEQQKQNYQLLSRSRTGSGIIQYAPSQHIRSQSGSQATIISPLPHLVQQQLFNHSALFMKQPTSNLIIPAQSTLQQAQQLNINTLYSHQTNQLPNTLQIPLLIQGGVRDSQQVQSKEISKQGVNGSNQNKEVQNLENKGVQNLDQSQNQKQSLEESLFQQNQSIFQNYKSDEDEKQAQFEEVIKMKNEIQFLNTKLKLKEEEVNIFQQYVIERKEAEKEKQILIQQLEEAKAQNLFLQYQQQRNSNIEGINEKDAMEYKDKMLIQQNEMIVLNRELQNLYKQIQYQESQLHSKEKINQDLKNQLEEKNEQIRKQKEEIIVLQGKLSADSYSNNPNSNQSEKDLQIKELDSQSQILALKIQSLERNLVFLEKENRKLKNQQIESVGKGEDSQRDQK